MEPPHSGSIYKILATVLFPTLTYYLLLVDFSACLIHFYLEQESFKIYNSPQGPLPCIYQTFHPTICQICKRIFRRKVAGAEILNKYENNVLFQQEFVYHQQMITSILYSHQPQTSVSMNMGLRSKKVQWIISIITREIICIFH